MTASVGLAAWETRVLDDTDMSCGNLSTATLHLLCEMAAHNVLAPGFGPDDSSVGLHNDIWFWGDARLGETLHAEATITGVDGRRVAFNVFARAGMREIARGTHTRMLVSRTRFLASLPAPPARLDLPPKSAPRQPAGLHARPGG